MAFIVSGFILIGIILLVRFHPVIRYLLQFFCWRVTTTAIPEFGHVPCGQADIHYVVYGEGAPVVLLHGGLSNKLSWFSQLPSLVKSGRKIILLETRGHGKSTRGKLDFSYQLYARDVICVLDRLDIQAADIIGWSDGGNTALVIGHDFPHRVKHIVAISANYHPTGLTAEARREQQQPGKWYLHRLKGFWTQTPRYQELEQQLHQLWRTAPDFTPADLAAISAPTLIIVGEADVVLVEHSEVMANAVCNGELHIIAGAGHSAPITHADQVNRLIDSFLCRSAAGPAA